ncbi:MAG TPA: DUF488 domain-containing protein [Thermoanaerobaculia bacterium]|nr:DUF488 domain-containing protein [Thermoanaerobaculia bacterium]
MTIYSIGHSTRTLDELIALLREHDVTRLADVRRYPGSRRYPHFSREALQRSLPDHGILYEHFEDLGGRRRPDANSPNTFWENPQFRAYADYMATPEFHAAVDRLLASDRVTAYMCAEAVPWRCHRNLLSDELVRRGIEVRHIVGPRSAQPHALHRNAKIAGDHLIYTPSQEALDFGSYNS